MSETAGRRCHALLPLFLLLAVACAPVAAVAQSFDVLHAFDSPPREPYGALIKGSSSTATATKASV